jgi:hypothetical protein
MLAVITIFKIEFNTKIQLLNSIKDLSVQYAEVGDAYTFSPKPGKLFELLNLLRDNGVNYGTHFNVIDETSAEAKEQE